MSTVIHAFEKALVQIQERVKADWTTYERYLLHKKAFLSHSKQQSMERTSTVCTLNLFLSSGDRGAREAHWASRTQNLYPILRHFRYK